MCSWTNITLKHAQSHFQSGGKTGECATLVESGGKISGTKSPSPAFGVLQSPISMRMDWWIRCIISERVWIDGKDILFIAIAAELHRRSSKVNSESRMLDRLWRDLDEEHSWREVKCPYHSRILPKLFTPSASYWNLMTHRFHSKVWKAYLRVCSEEGEGK